jgi:hypothetical protein
MTTLIGALILDSFLNPIPLSAEDLASPAPWGILAVVFVAFVPLHELLHLIWHPGWGLSDRSRVVVWLARLRVGVYYEGDLSRSRWMAMRAAPFLLLSLAPAYLLLVSSGLSLEAESGLSLLMILNALGSGGDALALLLILRQVPASGRLRFRDGRARWSRS